MNNQNIDGKVYLSMYVGIGQEGRTLADTLKKKAKQNKLSLSEFLLKAGLQYLKADTYKRKADTQADTQDLPPSLRGPARAVPVPSPRRTPRFLDDQGNEEGFTPPTIDTPAPSSKPILVD